MVAPIISPDGSLSTKSGQFVIGAIFDSGMNFVDTNMVFMDLAHAQDFFGRAGKVDGVDIHLVNLDQTDAVTDAVSKLFPNPYRVRNWIEFNESAAAGFELLKRVYALVLVMLIGVAAFNLVATLIMVVMEKRKDIAVLIAMGATRRDVRLIFVLKGLIVGAAGTVGRIDPRRGRMLRAGALPVHSHPARNLRHLDAADRRRAVELRRGRARLDAAVPARDRISGPASIARNARRSLPLLAPQHTPPHTSAAEVKLTTDYLVCDSYSWGACRRASACERPKSHDREP